MIYRKLVSAVAVGALLTGVLPVAPGVASSHMDAPLITFDAPANTTDVYAFRSQSEDGATQYGGVSKTFWTLQQPTNTATP